MAVPDVTHVRQMTGLLPQFHDHEPTNASIGRLARKFCDLAGDACADGFHCLVRDWIRHHGRTLRGHGGDAGKGQGRGCFRQLGAGQGKPGIQVLSAVPGLWRARRAASLRTVRVFHRRPRAAAGFSFPFLLSRAVRLDCGAAARAACFLLIPGSASSRDALQASSLEVLPRMLVRLRRM